MRVWFGQRAMGSETQLIDRARAGDRRALQKLLERHEAQIYRFSKKMCRDEEDAKDTLQDTMLAVARGIRDFRGQSSLSTWLYTIARSHCLKKRRRREGAQLNAEIVDPAAPPDEKVIAKQIDRAVDGAIRELDPKYREVLVLRDVEGLSAQETAEIVGASVQAVKSRLHRARLAVRDRVGPLLGAAEPPSESCPDIPRMFSRYLEGEISAARCAQMEKHLEECPRCRESCDSLKRTLSACRTSSKAKVPVAIQRSVRKALKIFLSEPV